MKKKIKYFLFGIISIPMFSSFFNFFHSNTPSPGTKIAHQITRNIGKKLTSKYGLTLMGISEEGPNGKYIRIGLEMSYNKILSKDEGASLLISSLKETLEIFNSYPNFKQYMANYPFSGKNIIINIYIQLDNNHEVLHPKISVFSYHNDLLQYKTEENKNSYEFYSKEQETYLEASKRLGIL